MRWQLAIAAAVAIAKPAAGEPLRVHNGRLFIDARIGGVATEALLDSGAEATLVDPALARRARLPEGTAQVLRGSGGSTNARIVPDVAIEALGLTLHPEAVVVLSLTDLSTRLIKRPTQAIVGRELFDAARLRIDIPNGQIERVSSATPPRGRQLVLTPHAGIEAIAVTINGRAVQAEFDLGNGSEVTVARALAKRLGLRTIGRKSGGGIGGAVQRELVRLRTLTVAGATFRNLVAAVDDQPNANDMNVGTAVLKSFLITTDFGRHAVWLEPLGKAAR